MIYPNFNCYLYCQWLLNSSYQKFSASQTALINTISSAAFGGTSVTTSQYNLFLYQTSPYYRVYVQWLALQPQAITSSLDTLTTAWLATLSTTPTQQTIYSVDAFLKQLRADGNLLLDYLFIFAQDNQANCRTSIINPTLYNITEHGTPTWNANLGYTGNGSTMYLQTNFIDSADAVEMTQNNAAFGAYVRNEIGTNSDALIGSYSPSGSCGLYPYSVGSGSILRVNATAYDIGTAIVSKGFYHAQRTASNAVAINVNGIQQQTGTASSSGLSTVADTVMAQNVNGTIYSYSTNQFTLAFKGSGSINIVTFNSAVNLLMTNLGAHF